MNTVKIITSDNLKFEVERDVISMSNTIKLMIENGEDGEITLPNVTGKILDKVIVYCKQYYQDPEPIEDNTDDDKDDKRTDNIEPWDADFMKMDQDSIFEIISAANYLDIKPLLNLARKTVANIIKSCDPFKTFNIKNDFTPEEEAQIRKENS